MSKRILFAAAASMAIAAFAAPSSAQIVGSGSCAGLSITSAQIDAVSNNIRAVVHNSSQITSIGNSVRYRVELSVDGKLAWSPFDRLRPGDHFTIDVASTQEVFGKSLQQLLDEPHRAAWVPYEYFIGGGLLSFVDCTRE